MGTPLQVTLCFSLAAYKILSLSLTFGSLITTCLGVVLFGSNLFGILCASWTCKSIPFAKLGKFSFIIFSNKFPTVLNKTHQKGSVIGKKSTFEELNKSAHRIFEILLEYFLEPPTFQDTLDKKPWRKLSFDFFPRYVVLLNYNS